MRATLFACSHSSSLDKGRNSLSLFHLMDELEFVSFPAVLPSVSVAAIVSKSKSDDGDVEFRVKVKMNSVEFYSFRVGMKFGDLPGCRSIGQLEGLIIEEPGVLSFELYGNTKRLATWDIGVESSGGPVVKRIGAGRGKNKKVAKADGAPKQLIRKKSAEPRAGTKEK